MALKHILPLDGLRALAIIIVFIAHCGLEGIIPGGFGVTTFFFLSGYLITTLLRSEAEQTGRISLKAFYLRRSVRILPSLYITMFLVFLLTPWLHADHPVTTSGIVAQLAFVSNYPSLVGGASGVPGIPLWSLAVEEHFYLIFPLLFAKFFLPIAPRRAAGICFALCILVLAIRIATAITIDNIDSIYYWSHTRVDSILFGCCLALWQNPVLDEDSWRPRLPHLFSAVGLILFCFVVRDEFFRQTIRYTLQGAALFVVFSFVIQDRTWITRILSSRPLQLIGLFSYTLYLIHVPAIKLIKGFAPDISTIGMIVASGTLSMLYAATMYVLVERPAAAWRRRLHTADRKTVAVA